MAHLYERQSQISRLYFMFLHWKRFLSAVWRFPSPIRKNMKRVIQMTYRESNDAKVAIDECNLKQK